MITLDKIAYDLINVARGGKTSDDENISLNQVKWWISNTRALLIRRDLEKRRTINPSLIQTLPCMAVSQVDASMCPCKVSGCTIMRTDDRVPQAIELSNKNLITSISSIVLGSTPYSLIPIERAPYSTSHPLTKKMTKAFMHDGYVYLIGDNIELTVLTHISVSGVFEDPTDLSNYTDCDTGITCYDDSTSLYPIAAWMIEPLKEMIFRTNLQMSVQALTDNSGNAKGDVEPNQHN